MAINGVSWVLGAHVRLESLDFFVTTEGELARAATLVQLLCLTSLDTTIEALKELQLHASEACAPGNDQLLGFDYGRLERQLGAFLGP